MSLNDACPICRSQDLNDRDERLRDSDTIGVRECPSCRHVFLDSFDHVDEGYFERGKFLLSKDFLEGIEDRLRHYEFENSERAERVGPLVVNKRVLDFGCGAGQLMRKLSSLVKSIEGLERTEPFRQWLGDEGYTVHETVETADGPYDAILLFHVLEHLPDPVSILAKLRERLAPGGLLYIEVPNVNDALLTLYDVDDSRRFLFFSDHLQYFSRQSLSLAIERAGFNDARLSGHSRFGLANHLYWLKHGKPGGHNIWNFLETPQLHREYTRALGTLDMTDSLVAQMRVGRAG